ncbi:MAG: NADP-dependent oxidoreductase [Thermoplasmata archaeon]|nr:NADP-dependent oxidoreductase [Thermoplasmata archaeon]
MRAIAIRKIGDVPELMDLPKPTPGEGEVLVHLGAAGVNPFDWKVADGALQGRMPYVFPFVLGVDGAGAVEEVGPGVKRLQLKDGVFGQFLHPPAGIGTYAEYVVAPETLAISVRPRGMYNDQASAVPTPGMTALDALDRLALEKRQSLLILGAGGGVGSFAVQLASNRGITTLAASKGPNRDFLHKLGASRFYDASAKSFLDDVKLGYPNGVDAILDLANRGPEFEQHLALLKPGGTVASTIGAATPEVVGPRGFQGVNINLQPTFELLDRLSKEFSSGKLRIPMEEKIPLAGAVEAIERSRAGKIRGKIVLTI